MQDMDPTLVEEGGRERREGDILTRFIKTAAKSSA